MRLLKIKLRPLSLMFAGFLFQERMFWDYFMNVYRQYVGDVLKRKHFNSGRPARGHMLLLVKLRGLWWSFIMIFFAREIERFSIQAFRWVSASRPENVRKMHTYWLNVSRVYLDYKMEWLSRRRPRGLFGR